MGNTETKLLSKEQLKEMHGKTATLGFKTSEVMPSLDGDIFWIDPEVYLEVDGKVYSKVTHGESSPITLDGERIEGEREIEIVKATYTHQIAKKAGVLWGENKIHYHQYAFHTSDGKVYLVNVPLYR